jgi:type VI secretion system protein VasG
MSEFQEPHTVSTLKGSPPGYVGYGEGGVLTEAVRRRPYSVVLLDEVEKAHPDVLELFYRVFDKGVMEDGEGREIDFRNTVILLTSNACTEALMSLCSDPQALPDPEDLVAEIKPALDRIFKPALLGRMVIVPYYPIRDEALKRIITLKLGKIKKRMFETHRLDLVYDQELVETIAERCTEVESGARNVDHILTGTLIPEISERLLCSLADHSAIRAVSVDIGPSGAFQYQIE